MMLREVEGVWVQVPLLTELTVAMVMAADATGVAAATVRLASACFSPGPCPSITQVTRRLSNGKTAASNRH